MLSALLLCLAPVAVDGDTIHCANNEVRIRLFGVNSPERNQQGYAEAKASLQIKSSGGVSCQPRGASYNRIVAQCWNGHSRDLAADQLADGHAKEVCGFSKNLYGTCPKPPETPTSAQ